MVYHQRSDTEEKLAQAQGNWWYWAYLEIKRSGRRPLSLYAGLFRRLFTDTSADLFLRGDPELARLDIIIFRAKLAGMKRASKAFRKEPVDEQAG